MFFISGSVSIAGNISSDGMSGDKGAAYQSVDCGCGGGAGGVVFISAHHLSGRGDVISKNKLSKIFICNTLLQG
jgi:hypothetical protein